jgi:CHAT domain-containing protein/Tfp pilus assembly protein PilF
MKPYPHDRQQPMNYPKKVSLVVGLVLGLTGLMGSPISYIGTTPIIAQTVEQLQTAADLFGAASQLQFQAQEFEAALQSAQQALAIYRQIKNRRSEQILLNQIGIGYTYRGNYPEAIQALSQSLAIAKERQDDIGQVDALINMGSARLAANDYAKAIVDNEKALAIAIKIKNQPGEAVALSGLGNNYMQQGNYAKAIAYLERSLVLHQAIKDQPNAAKVLNSLGLVYIQVGNYPKAIKYHEQSLAIKRAVKDRVGESLTLSNLGLASDLSRDYKQAIAYGQQALAITRELKIPGMESTALTFLGSSYQGLGDTAKAIEHHQKSLAIAIRLDGGLQAAFPLWGLTKVYQSTGDHAKAIEYGQQSLAIIRKINKNSNGIVEGRLLTDLAVSWIELGKSTEAETALRSAIKIWETQRGGLSDQNKISLTETQAETYQLLQKVLVQQNRTDAALEIAEKGRARAFAELLAARSNGNAIAPAPNLDAIRRIAKTQNATLVEYSIISPKLLYTWVIKPTGEIRFHSTPLDPNRSLKQSVIGSRSEINVRGRIQKVATGSRPADTASGNLTKLHQILIDPIAADLPTDPNQRVIFMPQGELFLLPFVALRDASGKYLIERHTLSISPSIQTLDLTHQQAARSTSQGRTVIVGDPKMPSFDGETLPPLPGSRQEAIAIGKILNTAPLLGDQATKAAVVSQMRSASVIHLATHGLLDVFNGDIPGAIALAPSGNDNGLLSAGEIFDLKLKANLVVLSACDTGRGEIKGDGVIGLSRSLIAAGVPSVVVSLWAVNDDATSVLMSDFYRNLKTNPNKAQSLRQAMLTTLKQYPNPADWAAFTLVGESD